MVICRVSPTDPAPYGKIHNGHTFGSIHIKLTPPEFWYVVHLLACYLLSVLVLRGEHACEWQTTPKLQVLFGGLFITVHMLSMTPTFGSIPGYHHASNKDSSPRSVHWKVIVELSRARPARIVLRPGRTCYIRSEN
ncbi:hypothetical protein HD554DRAFT_223081 [Boletus coccyginus]|nr:hypothetical protein HD554DRAFT_223081 [Boletus coccyginus]